MARRGQHKVEHPACPAPSWAACDLLEKVKYGQCEAVVGDKEPTPCSRWAVSEEGWCWQHYASEKERIIREERAAAKQLQLLQKIDAFLERIRLDPEHSWIKALTPSATSTVGLAGVPGVQPGRAVLETAPPARLTPAKRKPPHRIGLRPDELDRPILLEDA